MPRLDFVTAGESHGDSLVVVISGVPAGLVLDRALIDAELARRQGGYGRGARQRIETDAAEVLTGVRAGVTLGSPLTLRVANKDSRLDDAAKTPPLHRPRPGHADLAGSIKYLTTDCRGILERASARETAARTAAGAVARNLLATLGIEVFGMVRSILGVATDVEVTASAWKALRDARDASETYCPDRAATEGQCAAIRQAKVDRDTLGGVVEAHVFGCPPGIGSCMDWRDRLDARLAYAAMGIQAIKGVEIGLGFEGTRRPGSRVHDPIHFDPARVSERSLGFERPTNHAGGLEGGMTNGQPIVVRAAMKPISTLLQGMDSVDLETRKPERSQYERSDVCAVSAASVVLENVVAFEVARSLLDKFPGDTMHELRDAFGIYLDAARSLPLQAPRADRLA